MPHAYVRVVVRGDKVVKRYCTMEKVNGSILGKSKD